MPLQKEFQLIVKHILCIYGFFLAVLDSTAMPFSVMKCPIARNLMYESMFFFFLLCIAGSNKIWQVWRRRGHGFNFLRRLSIDSDTWKANKSFIILLFFSWRTMVFCYQNCSDLLREKNCSRDWEKTFEIRGWGPRICKHFEITRTICSNIKRSEQFLVT